MTARAVSFSVIVPTQDRPESLHRCLSALGRQTHPLERMEVIVVQSGAQRDASSIAARHPELNPRLVHADGDGAGAARNRGAQAATGERLAFLDDDTVPHPGWLTALAEAHRLDPTALHGGPVSPRVPDLTSRATEAIAEAARVARPDGSAVLVPACNLSAPRARFRELGGFNPEFWVSEDREFCERWLRRGWSIQIAPEAVVEHEHPRSLASFWRTHVRYGRGALAYHREQARGGHLDSSLRSSVSTVARAARRAVHEPQLAPLIALWVVATTVGVALEAISTLTRRSADQPRGESSANASRTEATNRSGANS